MIAYAKKKLLGGKRKQSEQAFDYAKRRKRAVSSKGKAAPINQERRKGLFHLLEPL
jgi:hypothetical protein